MNYKIYSYSLGLKMSQVATVLLWTEPDNGVVHCSEEHVSWEVFHTALLFHHSTCLNCLCLRWIERFGKCCSYCLSIRCALHVSAVIQVCQCQAGHEYSKIGHTTAIQKCRRSLAQDTARCICLTKYRRNAILDSTELTCSFHWRSLDRRAPTSLNVCTLSTDCTSEQWIFQDWANHRILHLTTTDFHPCLLRLLYSSWLHTNCSRLSYTQTAACCYQQTRVPCMKFAGLVLYICHILVNRLMHYLYQL